MLPDPRRTLVVGPARSASALALCTALIAFAGTAPAGDAAAGREKARACITCHGPLGLSQHPQAPNLAGQPAIYLVEQLKAFRGGARQNPVMNVIAQNLSDGDIDDLAAWYSAIEVSAREPQPARP